MKRKYQETKERVKLSDKTPLKEIFRLVSIRHFKEAMELIPSSVRHLPLRLRDLTSKLIYDEYPLLHFAVREGGYSLVKYLLDGRADIERKGGKCCEPPLTTAARNGEEQCCELLLDRGANIDARNVRQATPLMSALGHDGICKLLISRQANINARDEDGWTCLHYAIHGGSIRQVKLLLSANARIDIKDKRGQTPLDIAKEYGDHASTVPLIEDHMVSENLSGVISRGLDDGFEFSNFLVKGICDCRLFLIVAKFAYN